MFNASINCIQVSSERLIRDLEYLTKSELPVCAAITPFGNPY